MSSPGADTADPYLAYFDDFLSEWKTSADADAFDGLLDDSVQPLAEGVLSEGNLVSSLAAAQQPGAGSRSRL